MNSIELEQLNRIMSFWSKIPIIRVFNYFIIATHNLAVNGTDLKNQWNFSDRDVLLHSLPIFH